MNTLRILELEPKDIFQSFCQHCQRLDLFDNNILYAYIIDVMGHGIATAMQTSALRVLFQQAVGMNTSLAENESQGYCSTRRGALFRCALHLELSRQSGF